MYRGVIVPLVTPLDGSGAVDEESVEKLIASLRGKVSALMPTLSSGEGWKLSEAQWTAMVAYTKKYAGGLPVLAGVQQADTATVVARSRVGAELGVDAVVATTPFRKDISQEEIYRHYVTLRESVKVPLFIYNEAAISGNHIELETLKRICQLPGVVGIKESSGSPEFTRQLIAAKVGVPIFQGWENLISEAPGVDGYVMPLANLEPELGTSMFEASTPERQARINAVCEQYGLFREDWYYHIKKELRQRGILTTDRVVQ